jgi:glucose/mannose transport system substrate-binding protein
MFQKRCMVIVSVSLAFVMLLLAGGQIALAAGAKGKLEVFSWWTSGGEAAALEALFTAYKKDNPDVEIVNATVARMGNK